MVKTKMDKKWWIANDQTGRPLFGGQLVDWANIGDADLLVRKYNIKSAPGYVYK